MAIQDFPRDELQWMLAHAVKHPYPACLTPK